MTYPLSDNGFHFNRTARRPILLYKRQVAHLKRSLRRSNSVIDTQTSSASHSKLARPLMSKYLDKLTPCNTTTSKELAHSNTPPHSQTRHTSLSDQSPPTAPPRSAYNRRRHLDGFTQTLPTNSRIIKNLRHLVRTDRATRDIADAMPAPHSRRSRRVPTR